MFTLNSPFKITFLGRGELENLCDTGEVPSLVVAELLVWWETDDLEGVRSNDGRVDEPVVDQVADDLPVRRP